MYDASAIPVRRVNTMRSEKNIISMRAHAKINLVLCVGGPIDRPGTPTHGYHPICSYMHAIELADSIEIERTNEVSFDLGWVNPDGTTRPVEWAIEQDLVVRAHRALADRAQQDLGCAIRVRKSIPAGGGLGGGSSDAASVLMGLNELFGLGLDRTTLVEIAMSLGSDIAYFIDPGFTPPRPAIVSGFGERINRLDTDHRGHELTLIFPGFGCPTGAVYRAFDAIVEQRDPDTSAAHRLAEATTIDESMIVNDLYAPACVVASELGVMRDRLAQAIGRGVYLSGSGSTLFVLGRIEGGLVHELAPDWRVVHTRLC